MTSKPEYRRFLFRGIIIVIPLVILLLLELALRWAGYGPDLRLFVPVENQPDLMAPNPEVTLRYFDRQEQSGFGSDDVFYREKPDSTLRIFVLGGSTTAGFPYFYNGSFPAHFKDRLQTVYPEYRCEIINLGMTAVMSYTIRDFARECLDYDPDLLIIYTGHNEFYGALGSGSVQHSLFGTHRGMTLFYLKLKHLKLYQLVNRLTNFFASRSKSDIDKTTHTLMAQMAEEQTIPYRSDLYRNTINVFEKNMTDIVRWAQDKQVPVVLGSVISNLRDLEPFVSIPPPETDSENLRQLLTKYQLLTDPKTRRDSLISLLALDSTYAQTHYYLGQAEEALKRWEQARKYYEQARDLDGLRFRASSDINRFLRRLSQKPGVYLWDAETRFRQISQHGLIGNEYLLEHVHPNLEGYFYLGKFCLETILGQGVLTKFSATPLPSPHPMPPDSYFRDRLTVTRLDRRMAEIQMQILFSDWPFDVGDEILTLSSLQPKNALDKVAIATLQGEYNYWQAHQSMIDIYQSRKDIAAAIHEGEALRRAFPHRWESHDITARLYIKAERFPEALPVLQDLDRLHPTNFSQKWIGMIFLNNQKTTKALPYLSWAYERNQDDPQLGYNLAGAYLRQGESERAKEILQSLVSRFPTYRPAVELLKHLKPQK